MTAECNSRQSIAVDAIPETEGIRVAGREVLTDTGDEPVLQQGGAEEARQVHALEAAGSNPALAIATNTLFPIKAPVERRGLFQCVFRGKDEFRLFLEKRNE